MNKTSFRFILGFFVIIALSFMVMSATGYYKQSLEVAPTVDNPAK